MQTSKAIVKGKYLSMFVFLLVFQEILQIMLPPMRYWDEFVSFMIGPMFFLRLIATNYRYSFTKKQLIMFLLLILFEVTGFVGAFWYHYQPLSSSLSQAYVVLKFYMAIGFSFLFFDGCDFRQTEISHWKMLNTISGFLFCMCCLDLVFHIFPGDMRMGIRAVRLFYGSYTVLAAMCVVLSAQYLRLYEYFGRRIVPGLMMLSFVTLCTLRIKAFCALVCIFFIYHIVCRKRRRIGFLAWAGIGFGVLLIAAKQFSFYFLELSDESARSALTKASLRIAADHFPFGTGWGTFGSFFSTEPYSPIYHMYRLSRIWGLSPSYHSFVTDTFWPMLLGEAGVFGVLFFAVVLLMLIRSIFNLGKTNAYAMASGLISIIYLVISSTSESSFAHPFSVPFAFWLGFLFAENKKGRNSR